ncbi:MAG: SIS domain-containing protein [Patescibacteria group bacterium]|nr:SIS domain-containing protein [Patescibacteria group bacterium]
MTDEEIGKGAVEEIKRMLEWMRSQKLELSQVTTFVKELLGEPKRIFLTGVGRSGEVAECFAMRLAQLGFDTRVLGEPTAPSVEKDDLFIVVSGGGEHQIEQVRIAREIGAKIITITSQPESTLARLADEKLIIPGRTKNEASSSSYEERRMKGEPVMPLGTAFEDFTMIVLDSIIGFIGAIKKKTEEELEKRHARPE